MALKRIRRKILVSLAWVFLTLAFLVVTSPLWFPWTLKPFAARYGAHFKTFERAGYGRLILTDVSYAKDKVTFHAHRMEVLQPITWLSRYLTKNRSTKFARVLDWEVDVAPGKASGKQSYAFVIVQKQELLIPKLQNWIPVAELQNGVMRFGTNEIKIAAALWDRGILKGDVTVSKFRTTVQYTLDISNAKDIRLHATIAALEVETTLRAERTDDAFTVAGDLLWRTNHAKLAVAFAPDSVLPTSASIVSESFRIPARDIGLKEYRDLNGSFVADWKGTNFSIDLSATADGQTNSSPPIHALVHARGNTNAIRFKTLSVALPWARAELSKNVEVSWRGKLLSDTADFTISAELSNQPFFPGTGVVSGEFFLRRSDKQFPDGTFKISARDLTAYTLKLLDTKADGVFSWPDLAINHLGFQFAEGGVVKGNGTLDLEKKSIGEAAIKISGPISAEFLPKGITYKNLIASAKLRGPIRKPSHEVSVELTQLASPQLQPVDISAHWQGELFNLTNVDATLSASNSVLRLAGSAAIATNTLDFDLRELTLSTNGTPALALQKPAKIVLHTNKTNWGVTLSPLRLRGAAGGFSATADVDWPHRGSFSVGADHLRAALAQDFLRQPLADANINTLRASGGWTNSPIAFSLSGSGDYRLRDQPPFTVRIKAVGNNHGLQVGEFLIASGNNNVIAATGKLPFRIEPLHPEKIIQIDFKEPINFHATTKTNTPFWDQLAKLGKLKLQQPEIGLDITGTLEKPAARVSVRAGSVEYTGATRPIPRLAELHADIRADRESIRVEALNFKVEGQPVFVRAEMPIGKISTNWMQVFDWRKGSGAIVIKQAQVAPFIAFVPAVLMPSGSLDLNVTFSPGMRLNGDLLLQGVETRSFGTIGSLHDLRAQLKFTESVVQFTNVTGVLGGETIGLSGFINFAETTPNKLPLFDLNIAGKAVPLTRKPDLILRADIELNALNTRTNEQPVVSGLVNFNDSFFLGDLKMLLPGKVTKPRERPPYFSVEAEPFSKWNVNLRLTGDNFLKVRTPLFRGSASANLRVRGTLREPIALGDAKIESGQIQFPFANLRVQQGFVSLTSDDPYRPHIFATAASRTFGYDVQMTMSGPANNPLVEFSSTPPLTSEQVVLMMTAGELPRREASFSTEQRAGRLALFVGKSILSKFTSNEGGAERLTLTSGENITEQGKQTYSLEYKITEDVSLVGEYDRFGAWNAGVKWRVYSK
ncbi:MAG: hypothetical protein JWM68_4199 [Verrucomicrobiales bacterium]|nr:hypothetical protein [Verrucomicrobiales bacterium]